MSNTLVITATITPPAHVPGLVRTDPAQRLEDYCQALEYYLRLPPALLGRIVFVENSLSDLSPLRALAQRAGAAQRMEWISFSGLDHPPSYGRGYGEFKLLDYAMDHSLALKDAGESERFWKVTGRYRVLNLEKLIRRAPAEYELYCDLRDRPIPWMDLRIFSFTSAGYRRLLMGVYPQLREDVTHMSPERYLRPVIGEWAKTNRIVTRFPLEPHIDGFQGRNSENYSSGVNLLKYWVRSIGRWF